MPGIGKFKILMVLDHRFPTDARVEYEGISLVEAGFEVGLLAISSDDRPGLDVHSGIKIFRDRIPQQIHMKMRGLVGTLPFMDWYLDRRIRKLHRRFKFDALHVHDLYLFGGALRAARHLGVPVVGDLHENWVEALRHYAWSTRFPGKLVVSIPRWEVLERRWVGAVDHLVVVIEEAVDRNIQIGADEEKIVVVPNTPRLSELDDIDIDEKIVDVARSDLTIAYVGGFDLHRGLESTLHAMPRVLAEYPRASLLLVGDGRNRPELEALSVSLGIDSHVRFEGWQPFHSLKSYLIGSDIGLVPHLKTKHTDATIPHKLFQYMYFKMPVIVSDCLPLQRIVEDAGAGLVYPSGDPKALASAILEVARAPERAVQMGERGHNAVVDRYNWDATVGGLISVYQKLQSGN